MKVNIDLHAKFPQQIDVEYGTPALDVVKLVEKKFRTQKFSLTFNIDGKWLNGFEYDKKVLGI